MMYRRTLRRTYPATLIQYARDYADISGASFSCVDPQESRYHFTPGVKLGNALLGGKE